MLFKLILILINIIYYLSIKKCSISLEKLNKIVYENIHEGDEDDVPISPAEVKLEKMKTIRMMKSNREIDKENLSNLDTKKNDESTERMNNKIRLFEEVSNNEKNIELSKSNFLIQQKHLMYKKRK